MLAVIPCRIFCLPVCFQKNIKIRISGTIILSVLCGCETWSLKSREESRLRVFQNRVLRIIFGPMGKERRIQVSGGEM
jgi:hypothetical protein